MQLQVLEKVKEILTPLAADMECGVVDMTYRREGSTMVLRVLVDKPGGITLEECTGLNNRLSSALDTEAIIGEHYIIEVSSPGLDRPLKTKEDFKRVLGKALKVSTYAPVDEKRNFQGTLVGLGKEGIVLEDESGTAYQIPMDKIASAKVHITF